MHWELLKSPVASKPLALHTIFIRRALGSPVRELKLFKHSFRVLLVVARPFEQYDIGLHNISRPICAALGVDKPDSSTKLDTVRPGTFEALDAHLSRVTKTYGTGYYDIIHLDVHGEVLETPVAPISSNGANDASCSDASVTFVVSNQSSLLFTKPEGGVDKIQGSKLASLINSHGIPVVLMNSCQSSTEAGQHGDSIARILAESGCSFVIGMSFTITATLATVFTQAFYQSLSRGNNCPISLFQARQALSEYKDRRCGQQYLKFEDWFLPVGYFHGTIGEADEVPEDKITTDLTKIVEAHFLGRDLDILRLERSLLLDSNIIAIHGPAGIGKTSLLNFLGKWWQMTGLVKKCIVHEFTESADSFDEAILELCTSFGDEISPPQTNDFMNAIISEGSESCRTVVDVLREKRHLLLFDNVQSTQAWNRSTVMRAKKFLSHLEGGQTLVLLSTRQIGREIPIISKYESFVYRLPGLDNNSVGALVDSLLLNIPKDKDLEFDHTRWSKSLSELRGNPLLIRLTIGTWLEKHNVEFLESTLKLDNHDLITSLLESFRDQLSEHDKFLLLSLAPFGTRLVRSSLTRYGTVLQRLQLFPDLNPSRLLTLVDRLQRNGLVELAPEHFNEQLLTMNLFTAETLNAWMGQQPSTSQELLYKANLEHFVQEAKYLSYLRGHGHRSEALKLLFYQFDQFISATRALIVNHVPSEVHIMLVLWALDTTRGFSTASKGLEVTRRFLSLFEAYPREMLIGRSSNSVLILYWFGTIFAERLQDQDEFNHHVDAFEKAVRDYHEFMQFTAPNGTSINLIKEDYLRTLQADMYTLRGINQTALKDLQAAIDSFDLAVAIRATISSSPEHLSLDAVGENYRHIARVALQAGKQDMAKTLLEKAVVELERSWPAIQSRNLYQALEELADLKLNEGDVAGTESLHSRALEVTTDNVEGHFDRAAVYKSRGNARFRVGQLNDAESDYREGLNILYIHLPQQDKEFLLLHAVLQYDLGQLLKAKGFWTEAIGVFDEALQEFQNLGEAPRVRNMCLAKSSLQYLMGDFEAAKVSSLQVRQLYQASPGGVGERGSQLRTLAFIYLDLDDAESALACLHESLKVDAAEPTEELSLETIFTNGLVAELEGDLSKGTEHYQHALEAVGLTQFDPENRFVNIGLRRARILLMQHDIREAVTIWETCLEYSDDYSDPSYASQTDWPSQSHSVRASSQPGSLIQNENIDLRALKEKDMVGGQHVDFILNQHPYYLPGDSSFNAALLFADVGDWRQCRNFLVNALRLYRPKQISGAGNLLDIIGTFQQERDDIDDVRKTWCEDMIQLIRADRESKIALQRGSSQ